MKDGAKATKAITISVMGSKRFNSAKAGEVFCGDS